MFARRPSKFTLFRRMQADLAQIDGAIGVDAASASFKTYPLFRTDSYFGVDNDLEALEQGRRDFPAATGILADIATVELPEASVDVCVSTNTMHWLTPDERRQAIDRLARLVAPTGWFILQVDHDEFLPEALAILGSRFEHVEVLYYRTRLSTLYEEWLFRHNDLDSRLRGALAVVQLNIARVMSLTDRMSTNGRNRNHAYVRCHTRRDVQTRNEFTVHALRPLADGIYALGDPTAVTTGA
jgi:SAM-dependent methyltransferase